MTKPTRTHIYLALCVTFLMLNGFLTRGTTAGAGVLIHNQPEDITYEEGTTGHFIVWEIGYPGEGGEYMVQLNGHNYYGREWMGVDIVVEVRVDGLPLGSYKFNIIVVCMPSGMLPFWEEDLVIVTVIPDETPPDLSPSTFTYEEGTTGHFLRWTMEDLHPGSYMISNNFSDFVQEGSWANGETIEYNIDGLTVGTYEFTLVVCDELDNCISDTVWVTVLERKAPAPAALFPNVLRILPLAVLAGTLVLLRRRRKHRPAT